MIAQGFTLALQEWHQRLRRLTTPEPWPEAELWSMLDESLPGRPANALYRSVKAAAGESVARAWWRRTADRMTPVDWMRSVGIMAIIAPLTHIALAFTGNPAGWYWLVLPGIALAFGVIATALSFSSRS